MSHELPTATRWKEILASLTYDVGSASPLVSAAAPARINLIGEHVDYMGGRVLPAALPWTCDSVLLRDVGGGALSEFNPMSLHAVAIPGPDAAPVVASIPLGTSQLLRESACALPKRKALDTFVAAALAETLRLISLGDLSLVALSEDALVTLLHGKTLFIEGHIPLGAGVSSSAALCVSLLYLFVRLASDGKPFSAGDKLCITKAARRIENDYCGVQCGIMDQFISVHGVEDCFLEVDCNTLHYSVHSLKNILGNEHQFVLVNSMIPHSLGDAYNIIRRNIERAQEVVGATVYRSGDFTFASAVDLAEAASTTNPLEAIATCLSAGLITPEEADMGSYVVEEMLRTRRFIQLCSSPSHCETGSATREIGQLLSQTHSGLSKQLRVSTEELDFVEEFCRTNHLTLGARLMGGGFGGCCLCLLEKQKLPELLASLPAAFQAKFGVKCEVYCIEKLGPGARCSMQM